MPRFLKTSLSSSLEQWYIASMQRKGLVYWTAAPLSWLFGWLVKKRRADFQSHPEKITRLPLPVIVVGNIVMGGTGKTPVVIALVQALRQHGYTPGVIARGYTRGAAPASQALPEIHKPPTWWRRVLKNSSAVLTQPLAVNADTDPGLAGDEPVLIAQSTGAPVVVFPQRVQAAQALLAAYPQVDVLISDDGLQHYALARDVELMLFDARGLGNGRLLPAGPLREAAQRHRDATLFVSTEIQHALAGQSPAFRIDLKPGALYSLANPTQLQPLHHLADKSVAAFAGIANPERFFATLRQVGARVEAHPLPDHYAFTEVTFDRSQHSICVITEKDAVKCARLSVCRTDPRLWVLPVNAHLPEALLDLILYRINSTSQSH